MALDNSAIKGNNETPNARILARLAKIKALQAGAQTEAEAQTAARLLQELLIKHHLEMSDIEAVELDRTEPVEKEYLDGSEFGFRVQRRVAWMESLAGVVAKAHFCDNMVVSGSNTVVFVGRKSDRDVAKRIFIYLVSAARELADREAAEYKRTFESKYGWDKPDTTGFKTSFFTGFVNKIAERYTIQRNEIEAAAKLAAEGEARARREADIENAVLERGELIDARVIELIDTAAPDADLDELVETARKDVELHVREEFERKPLEINPVGLMRLQTAEKAVSDWFVEQRKTGRVKNARGVGGGYRRNHNSAGYARGQAQGAGISMSGNVLR